MARKVTIVVFFKVLCQHVSDEIEKTHRLFAAGSKRILNTSETQLNFLLLNPDVSL